MYYNPLYIAGCIIAFLVLCAILMSRDFRYSMNRSNPIFWALLGFILYVLIAQPVHVHSLNEQYLEQHQAMPAQESGY